MAFHRRIDRESVGTTGGTEEIRPTRETSELAVATMACPECDAPVALSGSLHPAAGLSCPYCQHAGFVRDFLSLEAPTRPARVEVRVSPRRRIRPS
jgi:hypothetical protein